MPTPYTDKDKIWCAGKCTHEVCLHVILTSLFYCRRALKIHKFYRFVIKCLFSTGIVDRLWTTQQFTHLVMDSAMSPCLHFVKQSICQILEAGTQKNGAYNPEIQTRPIYLYNASTH